MRRPRLRGSGNRSKIAAVVLAAACGAAGSFALLHLRHGTPAAAHSAVRNSPATTQIARPDPSQDPSQVRSPVASPDPSTDPSPDPSPAATAPLPVPAADDAKKGVGAWAAFSGVSTALAESGASWYYTWATSHAGLTSPRGVQFVPMIWGPGSVNTASLRAAKRHGQILLGFNEPDISGQSNMTVAHALQLWPALMATGMQLGSPAVAKQAATPGGWLDRFMRGAAARGYRVNFIAVHWYGGDFATHAAVGQLKSYLQATYARYHKPIWLTEFALANFGGAPRFATQSSQAAFVRAATAMMHRGHVPGGGV